MPVKKTASTSQPVEPEPAKKTAGSGKVAEEKPAPNNLRIWEKVRETDKQATRPFSLGKYKGTEINPSYTLKKLTATFGPVGIGWGYSVVAEGFKDSAACFNSKGEPVGHEQLHWCRIRFWYVDPETGEKGEFERTGNTPFVQWVRSNQYFSTNDEAPKQSETDAIGKCASMLGFSADIYSGQWDDSKYGQQSDQSPSQPANSTALSSSAPPARKQPTSISKFDWAKLKEVTGFTSAQIAELAKKRDFPSNSRGLSADQQATLRFDLLLAWAKLQSYPVSAIEKELGPNHANMRDDQLIAAIRRIATSQATG